MGNQTPQPSYQPITSPRSRPRTTNILLTTVSVAILLATLFTAWTPASLFSSNLTEKLALLLTPEADQPASVVEPTPAQKLRIGIVAGHWGNDPGAVCPNGMEEAKVNLRIATMVQQQLTGMGFQTDLLQEFDERLQNYRAVALISIHNDSCEYINEEATGFKVAAAMSTRDQNRANRLTACLRDRYQRVTQLQFHPGSITADMREYHAFGEIDNNTVAAIIETGFLNRDYQILTEKPDVVAEGVVQGIVCFINNEDISPTPIPPPTP